MQWQKRSEVTWTPIFSQSLMSIKFENSSFVSGILLLIICVFIQGTTDCIHNTIINKGTNYCVGLWELVNSVPLNARTNFKNGHHMRLQELMCNNTYYINLLKQQWLAVSLDNYLLNGYDSHIRTSVYIYLTKKHLTQLRKRETLQKCYSCLHITNL